MVFDNTTHTSNDESVEIESTNLSTKSPSKKKKVLSLHAVAHNQQQHIDGILIKRTELNTIKLLKRVKNTLLMMSFDRDLWQLDVIFRRARALHFQQMKNTVEKETPKDRE